MLTKTYTFNNHIVFWPDRNLLSALANSENAVQITSSAARCLELMIVKADLVTQNELYDYGWKGTGFTPSPNTLYQSISVLRRAFRELFGEEISVILTETRKGFRLNPDIQVTAEEKAFVSAPETSILQAVEETKAEGQHIEDSALRSEIRKEKKTGLRVYSITAVALCAAISLALTCYLFQQRSSDIFENYRPYHQANRSGCIFYASPGEDISFIRDAKIPELNCRTMPYNYITMRRYSSSISIIACNKVISSRNVNCSVLFLRNKYEYQ